jgi:hypothetical protein
MISDMDFVFLFVLINNIDDIIIDLYRGIGNE